jgi:hypothetical protein
MGYEMTEHKTYTTYGALRRALEERLKRTSQTDQTDINRLRRQVRAFYVHVTGDPNST